ncbi:tetratricopeptide repeat protein [Streptomyces adelaidensis]|uniref:tetratricopeptide repeat protein n=1 Tax=Streptomyces adelaidensis TaxID=2796465 RepID=UPI00190312CE|nr:tetratricopeptide repeat protein [Streptomyces adelaidensis]
MSDEGGRGGGMGGNDDNADNGDRGRRGDTHNTVGGNARIENLFQAQQVGHVHIYETRPGPPRREPVQLPPEIATFVDRRAEETRFMDAVHAWRGDGRPLVAVLSGLRGVGKTTFGCRLARKLEVHARRERREVSVLYTDLESYRRDGCVDVGEVLGELLGGLGVAEEELKQAHADRVKQYREKTYDRRIVLVVDNVRTPEEAEQLLPTSEESVALLAGQVPLNLPGRGHVDLPVRPLDDNDAIALLAAWAGEERLADDPEAVRAVVHLCEGLPLALETAGKLLLAHPVRRLVRLLDDFAGRLRLRGLPETEAVWDVAHDELTESARRLYWFLAAAPAHDLTLAAVVALFGEGRDAADDAVEELLRGGLTEVYDGHLRMHGLVRAHAQRRARDAGFGTERRGPAVDAVLRLIRWYLRQAQLADREGAGSRMTFAALADAQAGAVDVRFVGEGKAPAIRWMEAEREVLHACVRIAYAYEAYPEAWALCEPLWTHYLDHPRHTDAAEVFHTGLQAALRDGRSPAAVVRMRCLLARPLWSQGRYAEAQQVLDTAVDGARALHEADPRLRASALEFRGRVEAEQERWADSLPYYERSLAIHQETPNPYGVLLLEYLMGRSSAALGQLDRARDQLRSAHTAALEQGRERMTTRIGFELAGVLRRLRLHTEARELYEDALAGARRRGSSFDEERVLDALGAPAEQEGTAGDPDA